MQKKEMRIEDTIEFLKLGLMIYKPANNSNPYNIKSIDYINHNSIVVIYKTDKIDRLDIRIEISEIISFVAGFYLVSDDEIKIEAPKSISVKALNQADEQKMFIISSIETAQYIIDGRPIEWMKNSIIQDTTEDFLIQNAKRLISKIENALRDIIYKELHNNYQHNWISKINETIYKSALKQYKKKTEPLNQDIQSKDILLYTFLPNLKQIIEENWSDFLKYFLNQNDFSTKMTELNHIRRDESHNRKITTNQSESLQKLYDFFLMNISVKFPNLVPEYIVENWHTQLTLIINNLAKSIPNLQESDRGNFPLIILAFIKYQQAVELAYTKLNKVLIPINKKHLHNQLTEILNSINTNLKSMLEMVKSKKLDNFQRVFNEYEVLLSKLTDFGNTYLFNEL